MANPLDVLVQKIAQLEARAGSQPSYRWGVVTNESPLRVRLDGDSQPLPFTPDSLEPLYRADRVLCVVVNRRLTVIGVKRPSGLVLPPGTLLHQWYVPGVWMVPFDAVGVPDGTAGHGGSLLVMFTPLGLNQTFTDAESGDIWVRSIGLLGEGPWRKLVDENTVIGRLRIVGAAGQPAFENGWENYGTSFAPVGFYKNAGQVHLQGLARKSPVDTTVIFGLPAGYRPDGSMSFEQTSQNSTIRVQISSSGAVAVNAIRSGTNGYVFLDGISFRARAA